MVPVLLLLISIKLGCSTACTLDWSAAWRIDSQRTDTLHLLKQMKIVPVLSCLRDRTDFRCPWKKGHITQGKQREEATCCYSEMLRQVLQLFRPQAPRDAWPERTIGRLLTSLLSGLEALEGTGEQTPTCLPTLAMAISTYFLRISRYLEVKGYSPCSWEIVRALMEVATSIFPLPAERTSRKRRSSMQESMLR
ncbi:interferon alpha-6-like [Arvicola amphibius]|uniref:interferon alpha-6-like n=1 Tax=Arvicola amphibius TaxID=1047088 RepID=UPI0018E34349|nr:interferon alpha-6-like [Arvicola amphibius]